MIPTLSLAAFLSFAWAASADEAVLPVTLEATLSPSGPDRRFGPSLRVLLIGKAKEASVVTDGLSVRVVQGDKKAIVSVSLVEKKDDMGRRIVPSTEKLGVVRLESGEVAVVHIPNSADLRQAVKAASAGEVELVVEYEVSKAWAKRFGVVECKVRSNAVVTKLQDPR